MSALQGTNDSTSLRFSSELRRWPAIVRHSAINDLRRMKILSATLRLPVHYVVTLPAPAQHRELLAHARELGFSPADVQQSEPGFWTNESTYVCVNEAAVIMEAAWRKVRVQRGDGSAHCAG